MWKFVHWSGTIKKVEPFTYDLVFGKGGVKVAVEISEVKSRYRSQPVDAALSLSTEMLRKSDHRSARPFLLQEN